VPKRGTVLIPSGELAPLAQADDAIELISDGLWRSRRLIQGPGGFLFRERVPGGRPGQELDGFVSTSPLKGPFLLSR